MNTKMESTWGIIRRGSSAILMGNHLPSIRRKSKIPLRRQKNDRAGSKASLKYQSKASVIPEAEVSLFDRIKSGLFEAAMADKKYSDVIRTAHIVTLETRMKGVPPSIVNPASEADEDSFPDRLDREMTRMAMIIETLLDYFSTEPEQSQDEDGETDLKAEKELMAEFVNDFLEEYRSGERPKREFNLANLFSCLQEEFKSPQGTILLLKVKSVLKFLHISVIIYAIEELRKKLSLGLQHLTKDMKDGWEIKIRMSDRLLEISHSRRESVLKQEGDNYWEMAYNITLSFDASMQSFTSVRLAVNDLVLGDNIDPLLGAELKEKFCDGALILC